MIEQAILWCILAATFWFCGALFVIAWQDRPRTMFDPELGFRVSVRSWQKERGYERR